MLTQRQYAFTLIAMNNTLNNDQQQHLTVRAKYQNNFARHILGVTLHLQSAIMQALTTQHGHSQLRINFEAYISLAAAQGARLSDIARTLGISRQAANQTANQIEAAGYLRRINDPADKRAKILITTPRAKKLIAQGIKEANKQHRLLVEITGEHAIQQSTKAVIALNKTLGLLATYSSVDENNLQLAAALPRLSNYISDRLQTLTMNKGHPKLKRNYGFVLTAIGPAGGRIQTMAAAQDVSKQAISVIATELEQLGYIERRPSPNDPRQLLLFFTSAGHKLIADSVASVGELEAELSELIGSATMKSLKSTMEKIYQHLHLEEDIFDNGSTSYLNKDINALAQEIKQQLGKSQVKALAKLLSEHY